MLRHLLVCYLLISACNNYCTCTTPHFELGSSLNAVIIVEAAPTQGYEWISSLGEFFPCKYLISKECITHYLEVQYIDYR